MSLATNSLSNATAALILQSHAISMSACIHALTGAPFESSKGPQGVLCMQDLNDGTYHDENEAAGSVGVDLNRIRAVSWSTVHSLKLGHNDHSPVLLFDVDPAGTLLFASVETCSCVDTACPTCQRASDILSGVRQQATNWVANAEFG